jgi:hypothetical protein
VTTRAITSSTDHDRYYVKYNKPRDQYMVIDRKLSIVLCIFRDRPRASFEAKCLNERNCG